MKILGIDLGKYKSVACLFETETNDTLYFTFTSQAKEFEQLLGQTQPELVVFEACALTGWVYDLSVAQGFKVLVANPNGEAWHWKHVKRKTDRDDALKLAKLAAIGQIVPVHVPSIETRQYRQLVKYRKKLVSRTNQVQNSIRSLFVQQGISIPVGNRAWTVAGIATLSAYRKPLAECDRVCLWRGQLDLELAALDRLWEELHKVDQQLTQIAKTDKRVQLLESIPGVGRKTAEVVVAYLDDPKRFQNARQVSAYGGLVPRQHQSGETNRMGKITRRGPRVLRAALVEAAWAMLRYNPWAAAVYKRLCGGQKTRKKQAIIALARKLLVRCWVLLRKQEKWDEAKARIQPVVA
ncbi:IS110 family transposase [Pantanalinema rosaneae CENA516]|uniref:IS110 family transposase n=1 Tax=Pantanalinema rosaneae TaxID=1620701 RepID=UPI003D6E7685